MASNGNGRAATEGEAALVALAEEAARRDVEGEEEAGGESDDTSVTMVRHFTDPTEPLTMGFVTPEVAHLAAAVYAKGKLLDSALRMEYVRARFLMSRSEHGQGSAQAADVAKAGRASAPAKRGFLRRYFGGGKGDEGGA